jgi:phenylacetic acid degradation operon negative regulatory protein
VQPSPKSLILDLLSTLPEREAGSIPVRALVEAGGLFGFRENSMRVALARLLERSRVRRDERGRYRLGEGARAVSLEVRSWRRLEADRVAWSGTWIGVRSQGARRRAPAARSAQALRFLGFRELATGLSIRPENLQGGVSAARERLLDLGLAEGAMVFSLSDLDPHTEARARRLWDASGLADAHRRASTELRASQSALEGSEESFAMVESFLVGGRAIRQLLLDPLLPDSIAPPHARMALLEELTEYDAFGRRTWAAFLNRHGVTHLRTPADLRISDGAERLAATNRNTA